jgi:hypothetical protein
MKEHQPLISCLILFLGVSLSGYFSAGAFAETAPPEAIAAAEAGLMPFLELITPEDMINFGLSPGDNISDAVLGAPFQLYTITPAKLLNAEDGTPVGSLTSPTGSWLFPIVLDGKSRAILTVERMDGEWQAVTMGRSGLAGEMEKLNGQWPKAKGYEPKLIAIYQAASYFFTIPEKDSENFTPLIFNGEGFGGYRQATGPEYSSTAPLSSMLGPLKETVEENINLHRQ